MEVEADLSGWKGWIAESWGEGVNGQHDEEQQGMEIIRTSLSKTYFFNQFFRLPLPVGGRPPPARSLPSSSASAFILPTPVFTLRLGWHREQHRSQQSVRRPVSRRRLHQGLRARAGDGGRGAATGGRAHRGGEEEDEEEEVGRRKQEGRAHQVARGQGTRVRG